MISYEYPGKRSRASMPSLFVLLSPASCLRTPVSGLLSPVSYPDLRLLSPFDLCLARCQRRIFGKEEGKMEGYGYG